jgi:hypothetical protein
MALAEHHKSRVLAILTSIGLLVFLAIAVWVLLWHLRRAAWREFEAIETLVGRGNISCASQHSRLAVEITKLASLFDCRLNLAKSRLWLVPDYAAATEVSLAETLSPARFPELSVRLARLPAGLSIRVQGVGGSDTELAKLIAPFADKIGYFTVTRQSELGDQTLAALLSGAKESLFILKLRDTAVTNAGLAGLGKCTALKSLGLNRCQITDAGLAYIAECHGLGVLDLSGTQVTDAGLELLANKADFHILILQGTAVTDASLVHLARLRQVMMLGLFNTQVTDAGLATLKAEFAKRNQEVEISTTPIRLPR